MSGREKLPDRRACRTIGFDYNGARYRATLGFFADGRIGEIFMGAGKDGSALDIHTRDAAILASLALQHGATVEALGHALTRDADGRPESALGVLFDLIGDAVATPFGPVDLVPIGVPFSDGLERRCRACGLDDISGRFDASGDALHWVRPDLCSGCAEAS